ncbi:MAG TPA: autotransporter outer membrane beta-barrel domain-containing protein, partial [Reyranella sp.]
TYTILNATGGLSGAYSGVTSNFAFLTPSLSYDANNVYLLLFQSASAFAAGAQTPNQYAVGTVLDQVNATATGDLNTVLNALSVLGTQQGPAALNAISGQQYADFGTTNVQGAALFMNTVGQQMALARGGASGGQRQVLAQACEVEACDGVSPWSVWASALGGLGSVAGNGNSSTLTYNFGGAAAGIDYRLDPRFLVGLSAGYAAGNQWVDSFMGRGWTDTVSVIGYGSFTNAGFYADALAGYAWSGNQMQRQIQFPGLQRTANGSTGANQFLGQIETGYRIGIYAPAAASVTPFARLQGSTVTQNAFSEWGANSLSLNVAQQTTNSLRTVFGADLAGAIPLSSERSLALDLRLGWLHEYADTGRPITAAFAGAPSNAFTVYGATPQRDAAVIGFSAGTNIAEATRLYLRYDGEISTGSSNHTLNLGLRISW